MKNSILNHEGILGELLKLAKAIELGDFDIAEKEISKLSISAADLLAIQLESMEWATQIGKESL